MALQRFTQSIRQSTDSTLIVENDLIEESFGFDAYDDFFEEYADYGHAVKEGTAVTKVVLKHITVDTMRRFPLVINTLLRHLPNASHLVVSFHFTEEDVDYDEDGDGDLTATDTMASVLRCTGRCESLEVLYDEAIAFPWKCLEGHCALRELTVRHPELWDSDFLNVAFYLSSIPTLKRVHIEGIFLDIWGEDRDRLPCILDFFKLPLKKLTLHGMRIVHDVTSARLFAQGMASSSVEDLDLDLHSQNEESYISIFESLATKTNLRRLRLRYGREKNSADVCFPLPLVIRSNRNLTSLTASGIAQRSDLASVLEDPRCALTALRQGKLQSVQDACHFLAAVAKSKLVTVGFGLKSDEGFPETLLCELEGLCRVATLKSLTIRCKGPKLERTLGERLVEHLYGSYSLENISIYFLDDALQDRLQTLAKLNKAGRRYLISETRSSKEAGIRVLSEVHTDLDCLYTHLRENPSLCNRSDRSCAPSPDKKRRLDF